MATTAVKKKTGSMKAQHVVSRVLIYALLIVVAALMLIRSCGCSPHPSS